MSSKSSPKPEASPESPPDPRAKVVLASLGLLALLLHVINLVYLAKSYDCSPLTLACPGDVSPWVSTDTKSYLGVAEQIRTQGFLGTSYLRRLPGYPTALALSLSLTGMPTPVLWLGPLLAGAAAIAVSWIVLLTTRRLGTSVFAGLVFCCWPNTYQFSGLLLTDGIHGFVAVTALATTLWWRHNEYEFAAVASAGLWMTTQALRLTFFPLAILLPILLWKKSGSQRYYLISSVLWISLLLIPIFVIASNGLRHGLHTPSAIPATNLACYAVPRLKQEMGLGDFFQLREDCFNRFNALPIKERVGAQIEEARSVLLQHPAASLWSFSVEILEQMLNPLRPYYRKDQASLYPSFTSSGRSFVALFWLCVAGGLFLMARREPHLVGFLLATLLVLLSTSATSHLVGARLRFPLDLLFIPMAVVFIQDLVLRSQKLRSPRGTRKARRQQGTT